MPGWDNRLSQSPLIPQVSDATLPEGTPSATVNATGRSWRWPPFLVAVLVVVALSITLVVTNLRISARPALSSRDVNAIASAQSKAAVSSLVSAPPVAAAVYSATRAGLVVIEDARAHGGDLGSGFILDSSGDIITALHVVAGTGAIRVIFADGTTSSASIKSADASDDIAVLTASKLPAVLRPEVLGGPVDIGDDVYAVGNPIGLVGSLTAGVISGLDRTFAPAGRGRVLRQLIQFDAAVNPGSSGGPLLNTKGQVIGIVEGLANPSGSDNFAGIGFAVPISTAGRGAGEPAK